MTDDPQQARPLEKTRPDFVMPAGGPAAGAPGTGAAPVYEFFGPTVITGPVAGGNITVAADHDERDYMFAVADVYRSWRNQYILGPASSQESPFIPTDTAALVRRLVSTRPGGAQAGSQVQRRPVALPDAVNLYRRVLLLGKPGAGKSSYLQYLALQCTLPDAFPGLLPVLVELGAYAGPGPFLEFVRGFLQTPPNPAPPEAPFHVASPWLAGALESYLQQGRILLLLDGLNELPAGVPAEQAARHTEIGRFFAAYPRVRAVVTCRMLDYAQELDGAGFQTVLMDPWTVEQMAAYLQGRGDSYLLARLHAGDPLLLSLGQVPFLLSMLTELIANYPPSAGDSAATPEFLTSQSALFQQFVELLLDWATLKDQENAALFPRPAVVTALARLAAAMQAAGYRGTAVPHAWANTQLPADPRVLFAGLPPPTVSGDPRDHLLDFGCAATILDTPATRATVSFWHLTHQDYFAALAAGAQDGGAPAAGPLAPAADDLHSLAAALAPQPEAAIRTILAAGDPRAPLVAAKALLAAGPARLESTGGG